MIIHKEGYKIIPFILLFLIIFNGAVFLFTGKSFLFFLVLFLSSVILLINLLFFREPRILKMSEPGGILSVADGEVVVIEPTIEQEYFKDERIQVSVFMSVFNVHINHIPVDGQIVYQKYHDGIFLPAYAAKSSGENERCSTVIRTSEGHEILIRQIAGIMARRVVTYKKAGDKVTIKDQLGFIRFGSRVDLFLPVTAEIMVELNQKVKGGITIITKV
jgi:phosphatidylserine decarboxylase